MGSFYTNFTVQGSDSKPVMAAMAGLNAAILPCGEFVVVGEEESDSQDTDVIEKLAKKISIHLKTSVFASMNHDDDILMYWLFKNGEMLDSYNSAPDYFSDAAEPAGPEGGKANVLCELYGCDDQNAVNNVLKGTLDDYAFQVDRHKDLFGLLGLPLSSVGMSYGGAKEGYLPEGVSQEEILFVAGRPT